MADTELVIGVRVEDHEVAPALARVDAELKAAAKSLSDSKGIKLKIDADIHKLKQDLAEAEALQKSYNARIDAAENNRSKAALQRVQREKKANADALRSELEGLKQNSAAESLISRQRQQQISDLRLIKNGLADQSKEIDRAHKAQVASSLDEWRGIQRNSLASKLASSKEIESLRKQQDEVGRLKIQYGALTEQLAALEKKRGSVRKDPSLREANNFKISGVTEELAKTKAKLEAAGLEVHAKVDIKTSQAFGQNVAATLRRDLTRDGEGALKDVWKDLGRASMIAYNGGFAQENQSHPILKSLGDSLQGFGGRIVQGFKGLGDARLNIGPLSTSIQGLIIGVGVLSPIIIGLIASLGSLVAVAGSAAGGLGALALAGSGFGLAAVGMGLAVKPLITQFAGLVTLQKGVTAASTKHKQAVEVEAKALEEYGKKSKQYTAAQSATRSSAAALTLAQTQLKDALKDTDKETQNALGQYNKLRTSWQRVTDAIRPDFAKTLNQGFQTLNADSQTFGEHTEVAFAKASGGLRDWFRGLRGADARSDLSQIFSNANKSIAPLMDGIGHLATALRRVGAEASKFLPGIAKGFDTWAAGIAGASTHTDSLRDHLKSMMKSLKDVGSFTVAGGSLLATIFGAGVKPGQSFLENMTNALHRWNTELQSGSGQQALGKFFSNGIANAEAFFQVLAPVISTFMKWVGLITPFATALLSGAAAVAKVVAQVLDLLGLQSGLTALITTLGGFWAVGKILAAASAVGNFTKALLTAKSAAEAMNTASMGINAFSRGNVAKAAESAAASEAAPVVEGVAGGAAATAGAKALGGAAEDAAPAVATLAGETAAAEEASVGLGAALGPETLGLSLIVGGAAAAAIALGLLNGATNKTQDTTKQYNKTLNGLRTSVPALNDSNNDLVSATLSVKDAQKELNDAYAHGNTEDQTKATLNLNAAKKTQNSLIVAQNKANSVNLTQGENQRDQAIKALDQFQAQNKVMKIGPGGAQSQVFDPKALDPSKLATYEAKIKDVRDSVSELSRVTAAVNLQQLNQQRALQGMLPIADSAAGALAKLSRANQVLITQNIKGAGGAAKVAASAAKSVGAGVSQQSVINVVANTTDAGRAIEQLQGMRLTPKHLEVIASGGKEAVDLLQQIEQHKLSKKEMAIAQQGGPQLLALIEHIDGIKLKSKRASIIASSNVGIIVGQAAAALNGISGVNATPHINLISDAEAIIAGVAGELAGLDGRVVTTSIITKHIDEYIKSKGGGLASGRTAGSATTSLVGEGGGPEWVINRATGNMQKISQPTIMALGDSDYVIPTEGGYANRSKDLLKSLAKDLGIQGFAAGKPVKQLGIPAGAKLPAHVNPYTAGVVDPSVADAEFKVWEAERTRRLTALETNKQALKDLQSSGNDVEGKTKKNPAGHKKRTTQDWIHQHNKLLREDRLLNKGDPNDPVAAHQVPLSKIAAVVTQYRKEDVELHQTVAKIAHWQSVVNTDQTELDNYAAKYNATGDKTSKTKYNALYKTYATNKDSAINQLKGLVDKQATAAHKIVNLNKSKPGSALMALYDTAAAAKAGAEQAVQTASTQVPATALTGPANKSLADLIAASPNYAKDLGGLNLQYAKDKAKNADTSGDISKINAFYQGLIDSGINGGALTADQQTEAYNDMQAVPDAAVQSLSDVITASNGPGGLASQLSTLNFNYAKDQATSADTTGDVKSINDFYQGLINGTDTQGITLSQDQSTEAYNSMITSSASPTGGLTQDQQAQIDQITAMGGYTAAANTINEQYRKAAFGDADLGFSGNPATPSNPNTAGPYVATPSIVINTLHPGDPDTLRAIGDAATSGMGYQASRSNPYLNTGL